MTRLRHLAHGKCGAAAQKPEYHRDCGRRGHAQCVENVEENNVRRRHGEEDAHHVVQSVIMRVEDTMACDVHHTARRGSAYKNAKCGNSENGAELGGFRAHRRTKEVYSVVGNADREVEGCKQAQEYENP